MAETSGEILGGRYRLLGERTSFPFGAWWEAEDDQGARVVVLRMNAEVADPAAKARSAIDAAARIDSPHIVPWADGGVDAKGHGWLAATMYGPWSLNEHVSRGEGIPPAEAALLMHQLARAAAAAEAAGVLHNTLTAEFVRLVPVTDGGHGVKVYGYGLADLLPTYKPLRKQDAFLGVPDYMSPELCAGKAAEGASADIYAIGILMYEAVRGRPPFAPTFASASASTTLKRHIFEKPLPLHVRYANAPFIKTYEGICFKALAKTANRRQLTLAELEKELEHLIVDEMHTQVVALAALSGRGPTTARRLRTQVIAQIPVDEPKVTVQAAPAAVATTAAAPAATPTPEPARTAAAALEASRTAATVSAIPAAAPAARETAAPEAVEPQPKRTDSTLVFAGLGPAVREMAEAARKSDEEDESAEEEAVPESAGGAGAGAQIRGKKKKGRKASTGVTVVSGSSATATAAKAVATTPSAATIVTPKASEAPTGERAGTPAGAEAQAPVARIRKKDETTTVVAPSKERKAEVKRGDDQEEWFSEAEGGRKRSWTWLLLLLAAVAIVVLVILLMSGGKNTEQPQPQPVPPKEGRYPLEGQPPGGSAAPSMNPAPAPSALTPQPTATPTATTPPTAAMAPVTEPAKVEVGGQPGSARPSLEPTKPPEPAAKVEPKPEPAAKVEPKPEPAAKVEPKPEAPKDAPGSLEEQFRAQAKKYLELGIQAYKGDNFKLAVGYFKKAQEADPTNALAAQYLKKALEKSGE